MKKSGKKEIPMPLATPCSAKNQLSQVINFLLLALIISTTACAKTAGPYPDAAFFAKDITIVDIRTEGEWRQTGIVAGSKTITFFDENGKYDAAIFFQQLDRVVDKNVEFAIICRSGRRTRVAAQILVQNGYKVIDLKGGIKHLPGGINLVPYKP